MKKLTILVASFLLSSCVSYDQEVLNLNLSANEQYVDVGSGKAIQVVVTDDRMNKDSLGNKRLGEDVVTIKSNQNLVDVIKDKIAKDLGQNGFVAVDGGMINKIMEVHIITLDYKAYREFFVGNSKTDILLKIVVKDQASKASYTTKQSLSLDKGHFIMPLITTDEKTINFALQEAVNGILTNQKLLEFLKN